MLFLYLTNKKPKIFQQCGDSMRLTKKQIEQLYEICTHFDEIETFELEETSLSGIGPTISVKFSMFGKTRDTTIDITDVESW